MSGDANDPYGTDGTTSSGHTTTEPDMSLADLTIYKQKETLGIPKGMTAETYWFVIPKAHRPVTVKWAMQHAAEGHASRQDARAAMWAHFNRPYLTIAKVLIICVEKE